MGATWLLGHWATGCHKKNERFTEQCPLQKYWGVHTNLKTVPYPLWGSPLMHCWAETSRQMRHCPEMTSLHLRGVCNSGLATDSSAVLGLFTNGTQDPEIGVDACESVR